MREQQDGQVVVDRESAQEADKLSRLGPGVLVAGEDVGQRIENDEPRLELLDDRNEAAPDGRCRDNPSFAFWRGYTASRPARGMK